MILAIGIPWGAIIGVAAFLLILLPILIYPPLIGMILFRVLLVRTGPEKWTRECPTNDPEQIAMFEKGVAWHEQHKDRCQPVETVSDGLRLVGEFYDFGSDKTVLVMPGRSDSLYCSYFWAVPYAEKGLNVLVYDPRAHGMSEGKYNTVGFEEQKDVAAWIRYLQENTATKAIVLHGICVGIPGGLYTMTKPDAPEIVKCIVVEGMFSNFHESLKNHLIELKKNTSVTVPCINFWFRHFTGHTMHYGPVDVIHKLKTPLLMLHSQEDPYSLPHTAQELYDAAGSEHKELVWFPNGGHSRLRLVDPEKYDRVIHNFLDSLE